MRRKSLSISQNSAVRSFQRGSNFLAMRNVCHARPLFFCSAIAFRCRSNAAHHARYMDRVEVDVMVIEKGSGLVCRAPCACLSPENVARCGRIFVGARRWIGPRPKKVRRASAKRRLRTNVRRRFTLTLHLVQKIGQVTHGRTGHGISQRLLQAWSTPQQMALMPGAPRLARIPAGPALATDLFPQFEHGVRLRRLRYDRLNPTRRQFGTPHDHHACV
jgi:hypothetical protein